MEKPSKELLRELVNSQSFTSTTDIMNSMKELWQIYQAINEETAMNVWNILLTFFAYPAEIRRIIYTTNIIEGLNRQFRKITKNKLSFTNDDSLRIILYLAAQNIVEHLSAVCRKLGLCEIIYVLDARV